MALQHVMTCPKCGFVHSAEASAGVGKGRLTAPKVRGDHDKALAELSTPGPRKVSDGPRPMGLPMPPR